MGVNIHLYGRVGLSVCDGISIKGGRAADAGKEYVNAWILQSIPNICDITASGSIACRPDRSSECTIQPCLFLACSSGRLMQSYDEVGC